MNEAHSLKIEALIHENNQRLADLKMSIDSLGRKIRDDPHADERSRLDRTISNAVRAYETTTGRRVDRVVIAHVGRDAVAYVESVSEASLPGFTRPICD